MKVGIFGGSFNPPHNGHINSLTTVQKKLGLDKVHVVVAAQNPLKAYVDGPSPEQRLEMTKSALSQYGNQFVVDDQEIMRGGLSYTIDTVMGVRSQNVLADDLYLIIGADKFEEFGQWRDYQRILTESNLIVTTRPGYDLPDSEDQLPEFLKGLVADFDFNFIELKTGRNIQFVTLRDIEVSSTELRKWLRTGRPVEKYLPLGVENYIKEQKLYRPVGDKIADFKKFSEFCGQILFNRKGIAVKGYDLSLMSAPTEFSVIASGTSTRHAASLAENVIQGVKAEFNVLPQGVEGLDEGRWVVVDYGSLMIHVFYDFVRQEYSLEKLWKDAKDLQLTDKEVGAPKK